MLLSQYLSFNWISIINKASTIKHKQSTNKLPNIKLIHGVRIVWIVSLLNELFCVLITWGRGQCFIALFTSWEHFGQVFTR